MIPGAAIVAFAAMGCVIAAAVDDLRRFEIADAWPIAIAALFACHASLVTSDLWVSHLAGAAIVFAIGLAGFARGYVGGGDVKLLTAVALWAGLDGLPHLLAAMAVVGGIFALILLAARASPLAATGVRLFERGAPVPYAVAIAAGTLWWASRAIAVA